MKNIISCINERNEIKANIGWMFILYNYIKNYKEG